MKLKLDWCSHEAAKYAVEHWHYSRRIPKSKLAKIGVWEDNKFVGCVIFGVGATSDLVKRYNLKPFEGCELVRVALTRHIAPVSKILSVCFSIIKKAFPRLRLIVSFADPEQGHIGAIYQAGNWLYSGKTQASDEYLFKGKRWQGRLFRNSFKGMEHDPRVQIVKGSSKHRYLMPLDSETRSIIQPLSKPYPKRASSVVATQPPNQVEKDGAEPIDALQINIKSGL